MRPINILNLLVKNYKMLAVGGFRAFKRIVSQHGVSNHSIKSLSSGSQIAQKSDMPVPMENPYKQPEKGCVLTGISVDYRNVQLLSQFISPHTGRIYGRHITGLCGKKQKEVSKAIKKSISMGFMSVTHKHPQLMKDPNICDIRHME